MVRKTPVQYQGTLRFWERGENVPLFPFDIRITIGRSSEKHAQEMKSKYLFYQR
jgi:hypothetical protein